MRNMLNKLYWSTKHFLSHVKYAIRVRFNRAVHDYDQSDWWEYYSNNSARAVKLLEIYRKYHHGNPLMVCAGNGHDWTTCKESHHDEWDAIVGDMIFFHQVCAGDYKEERQGYRMSVDYDMIEDPEVKNRYRRGKYYYWKYYECLWD